MVTHPPPLLYKNRNTYYLSCFSIDNEPQVIMTDLADKCNIFFTLPTARKNDAYNPLDLENTIFYSEVKEVGGVLKAAVDNRTVHLPKRFFSRYRLR